MRGASLARVAHAHFVGKILAMVVSCAFGCNNRFGKTSGVRFYTFPKSQREKRKMDTSSLKINLETVKIL